MPRLVVEQQPPNLNSLRIGFNPITGAGIAGAQRQDLLDLVASVPKLETFSVGFAQVDNAALDGSAPAPAPPASCAQLSRVVLRVCVVLSGC